MKISPLNIVRRSAVYKYILLNYSFHANDSDASYDIVILSFKSILNNYNIVYILHIHYSSQIILS